MMEEAGGRMRLARQADLPVLVQLMTEFYGEAGFPLDAARASTAFAAVLDDPRLGRVWLVEPDDGVAGYVAVTFVFAFELGGMLGVIDDLFLRPAFRGRGLGAAALAEVRDACRALGLRALRVEVGRENAAARAAYRSAGLTVVDRQLMALQLARPLHEVGIAGGDTRSALPPGEGDCNG